MCRQTRQFWNKSNIKERRGFTLAEVLITLAIIGVVAAITIPNLIMSYKSSVTYGKLAKNYSVLRQVTNDIQQEGRYVRLDAFFPENFQYFDSRIKFLKKCSGAGGGCFPDVEYTMLNPAVVSQIGNIEQSPFTLKAIMADGTLINMSLQINNSSCAWPNWGSGSLACWEGSIYVDINGFSGPNRLGDDLFIFYYTRDAGLIPAGTDDDNAAIKWQISCNNRTTCGIWCGAGCTARILLEHGVNY
jgi:prepilin-type N-terminal cleavage/methylation domain-containing protein